MKKGKEKLKDKEILFPDDTIEPATVVNIIMKGYKRRESSTGPYRKEWGNRLIPLGAMLSSKCCLQVSPSEAQKRGQSRGGSHPLPRAEEELGSACSHRPGQRLSTSAPDTLKLIPTKMLPKIAFEFYNIHN